MLNQLSVVDFHGNPVSFASNYRLYMVYHVSSLKAVDGAVVVREPLELVTSCSDILSELIRGCRGS